MLVAGTAFLTLADGTKQAGLVGYSSIYLSKLCLIAIFPKAEYLGAYLYIYIFLALVTLFIFLL